MKINKIKKAALYITLMAAVGCTGDFETVNTNPQGATNDILSQDFGNLAAPMKVMFNNVIIQMPEWQYQLQQNLNADIWSGYMATPTGFAGGSNNTTYNLVDGWNGFIWNIAYTNFMANALKVEQLAKEKAKDVYAMSLILKVQAMHRVTDIYGPIVYSNFGTENSVVEYDSQEQVYTKMFSELDSAVNQLTIGADAGAQPIKNIDQSTYGGKHNLWIKYANSLRLRLAMRLVKRNPTLAKTQALAAINNKYGVMTSNADNFVLKSATPNAINTISSGWGDICMSADMESIMGGYNDPRISKYFSASAQFPGEYKGVRTGIEIASKADHADFSRIGDVVKTGDIVFVNAAQTSFLLAEAALRGWTSTSAKTHYENGITLSFTQHGVSGAAAYIQNNTSLPKAYVDAASIAIPAYAVNNSPAVSMVTIAWQDADSNEKKLEKIITQKWIAGFPEGQEAWSEYRRTGYPKLFPVLKNTSGGKITTEFGPRRINFAQSEKDGNPGGVASGISKLGGPDTGGTRLWWDTTGPNF
jgi:hypothetical protein